MMKYPIGIQAFDCLREEGYEYVDKRPTRYFILTSEQVLT